MESDIIRHQPSSELKPPVQGRDFDLDGNFWAIFSCCMGWEQRRAARDSLRQHAARFIQGDCAKQPPKASTRYHTTWISNGMRRLQVWSIWAADWFRLLRRCCCMYHLWTPSTRWATRRCSTQCALCENNKDNKAPRHWHAWHDVTRLSVADGGTAPGLRPTTAGIKQLLIFKI